jgi:flagellar biosynthesis/type III secretory pathway protein FliH
MKKAKGSNLGEHVFAHEMAEKIKAAFAEGYRKGREEGKVEGVRVWAEMVVANEKAAKAKV